VNIVYGSSVFIVFFSKLYGGNGMKDGEMSGVLNTDGRLEK
jgi:hypothetical protein